MIKSVSFLAAVLCLLFADSSFALAEVPVQVASNPNIILVMADDQGWGQTSYNNHPILKTPNLDQMAESGLRFNRFYAAAPVCSPTRASVLTGRTNRRTGVESHGYALRLQEKTLAEALLNAGYATGHFGKWHLNGMRGPGVPIFGDDTHNPGKFGFQKWLSVSNFFDRDPLMSRQGSFEEFQGDSSEIIVEEAIKFIKSNAEANKPSFTVIWFGTPHSPFMAAEEDAKPFSHLDKASQDQHGELVAMDRSIGTLRKALRDTGIANNTILWFTSDNGGLPKIMPNTVGGLRGFKGSVYEGGLRVPAIVEWPIMIKPRITEFPAVSMDIFPTLAKIVGLPDDSMLQPSDGISLRQLFDREIGKRKQPIPFWCLDNKAVIDNEWKLVWVGGKSRGNKSKKPRFELYNLSEDSKEKNNLLESDPASAERMSKLMKEFDLSIETSVAGKDYVGKKLIPENPEPSYWSDLEQYKPFHKAWKQRPEYGKWLKGRQRQKK